MMFRGKSTHVRPHLCEDTKIPRGFQAGRPGSNGSVDPSNRLPERSEVKSKGQPFQNEPLPSRASTHKNCFAHKFFPPASLWRDHLPIETPASDSTGILLRGENCFRCSSVKPYSCTFHQINYERGVKLAHTLKLGEMCLIAGCQPQHAVLTDRVRLTRRFPGNAPSPFIQVN